MSMISRCSIFPNEMYDISREYHYNFQVPPIPVSQSDPRNCGLVVYGDHPICTHVLPILKPWKVQLFSWKKLSTQDTMCTVCIYIYIHTYIQYNIFRCLLYIFTNIHINTYTIVYICSIYHICMTGHKCHVLRCLRMCNEVVLSGPLRGK